MDLKAELLQACPELVNLKLFVWLSDGPTETYFVNFYNLPTELNSCGAEKENNRMMFALRQVANGKFKLEHSVNSLARQYQLRGKTAELNKLVEYLARFLTQVIREVPPKYTHTKI